MSKNNPPIQLVKNEKHKAKTQPERLEPTVSSECGLMDVPFLVLVLLLVGIGLIMMFSASYARAANESHGNPAFYFVRQAAFAVAGVGAMWVISRLNYQLWRMLAFPILGVAIVLLMAVPLIGDSAGGATRWIQIGPLRFQPSEIAKIGMVLSFAAMMSSWKDRMRTLKYGVAPFVGIMGILAVLLYLQPHLSATMIILVVGVAMMFLGGTHPKWLVAGFGLAVLLLVVYLTTQGYSGERFEAWLHPEADAQGDGYQVLQSLMAIGSGGLTGLGFGRSRQKYLYLPEEHNDYIFAVVCEELGFIGAGMIILLFMLLIIRGYWLAMHARDRFGSLTVSGLTTLLAVQVFLNIGVVSNLLPSTGISLPFFSYGGTALMINLAEMGIILGVSRWNTNAMPIKDKKKKTRKTGGKTNARHIHLRRDRRTH